MNTKRVKKFLEDKQYRNPKEAKNDFRRNDALNKGSKTAIAEFFGIKIVNIKGNQFRDTKTGRFF